MLMLVCPRVAISGILGPSMTSERQLHKISLGSSDVLALIGAGHQ